MALISVSFIKCRDALLQRYKDCFERFNALPEQIHNIIFEWLYERRTIYIHVTRSASERKMHWNLGIFFYIGYSFQALNDVKISGNVIRLFIQPYYFLTVADRIENYFCTFFFGKIRYVENCNFSRSNFDVTLQLLRRSASWGFLRIISQEVRDIVERRHRISGNAKVKSLSSHVRATSRSR